MKIGVAEKELINVLSPYKTFGKNILETNDLFKFLNGNNTTIKKKEDNWEVVTKLFEIWKKFYSEYNEIRKEKLWCSTIIIISYAIRRKEEEKNLQAAQESESQAYLFQNEY